MVYIAEYIAVKRVVHATETKFISLTKSLPDLLFMREVISKAFAYQRHASEGCWIHIRDMFKDFY